MIISDKHCSNYSDQRNCIIRHHKLRLQDFISKLCMEEKKQGKEEYQNFPNVISSEILYRIQVLYILLLLIYQIFCENI